MPLLFKGVIFGVGIDFYGCLVCIIENVRYIHENKTRKNIKCAKKKESLWKCHHFLNLRYSLPGVQTLGASSGAIKNGMAAIQAHAIVQHRLALLFALVARIGQPAVGLQEHGRTEVFFAIPPVRGAWGRAARAEDAFVQPVEFLAVLGRLSVFKALAISQW